MTDRHNKECTETKKDLDVQLSPKVKETSELLNLRKMEEHMVKQKMYSTLYLASQRPTKSSSKSSRWREKKKSNGWRRGTKKCKLLLPPSEPSKQSSWPTSSKNTKTCWTSLSGTEKLRRKGCTWSSKTFIKTSSISRTKRPSSIRVNSEQPEVGSLPRGLEATSKPDLNRYDSNLFKSFHYSFGVRLKVFKTDLSVTEKDFEVSKVILISK